MSFINKIAKIFGEQEKQKRISIDDAIKIIENKRNEKLILIVGESYKDALQIYSEIQVLRSIISEFKKIRIEEKRARASTDVKDRFCASSERQLSSIEKPEKELESIKDFLNKTERTFASLGGLTPKQMMHIGFFFKGDISAISRKTVFISNSIQNTRKDMDSINEYYRFSEIREKIKLLEEEVSDKEKEKKLVENDLERFKSDLKSAENNISNISANEISDAEREFSEAQSRKGMIEQELVSLLAIEKMLKKLRHSKNLQDEILDAYIRSPEKAIVQDERMKVFDFIEQIIKISDDSSIDVDTKSMQKLRRILENRDYIKQRRKELIESLKNAEEKKIIMDSARNSIEERKKLFEMTKKSIENHINNDNREIEKTDSGITDIRKKIEDHRNELKSMAQRLTGSEIE